MARPGSLPELELDEFELDEFELELELELELETAGACVPPHAEKMLATKKSKHVFLNLFNDLLFIQPCLPEVESMKARL